jgi:hypothetical protein
MQAMLLIAVFSLFMSVAGSIVINSGAGSAQITQQRIEEMQTYFEAIEIVINDITRNNFQFGTSAADDIATLVRDTPDLSQLSIGRWADPMLDAWGTSITALQAREFRALASGNGQIVAPVTAIALISPGPNKQLETAIPGTLTIASLQGVLPPSGSDDIVHIFNNESAQRQNWDKVQHHLSRIAAAELRYYQMQIFEYRTTLMNNYLQQLRTSGGASIPDISVMMANDPNAPRFIDLSSSSNRLQLGVDDDFSAIERGLEGGGRLVVETTLNADHSATLTVKNSSSPTPWGNPTSNLSYSMTLKGTL